MCECELEFQLSQSDLLTFYNEINNVHLLSIITFFIKLLDVTKTAICIANIPVFYDNHAKFTFTYPDMKLLADILSCLWGIIVYQVYTSQILL